jgi:enoyl-CoA hydratase/carnithine racemase
MADTWTIIKEWPELILDQIKDASVARITLNRPDKRNCWNRPMCLAFLESLDIIRADKNIKAVITRGAGKVFSSGLDLTFLREVSNGPLLDWDRPNLTIQIA